MGAQFTVYRSLVVKILAFGMNDRYRGDVSLNSFITFVFFLTVMEIEKKTNSVYSM